MYVLTVKPVPHLLRNVLLGHFLQHVLELRVTYVDQHVGVSAVLYGHVHVVILTTVVVLDGFLFGAARHNVVIKLAPLKHNVTSQQHQLFFLQIKFVTS